MAELTVARTYAKALFGAAKDLDKVAVIAEELKGMEKVFENEAELVRFLSMPSIPQGEKVDALQDIFSGRVSEEFLNFICILVEKGRFSQFERIAREFDAIRNEEEGFSAGVIYSSIPLTPDRLMKFDEETGKLLREKVKLTNEIDESLLGGIKILINGKMIDASVKSRVSALADAIIK